MNIETFKISCRAFCPDCVFVENGSHWGLSAYTNKDGFGENIFALLDLEDFEPSVVLKSKYVPCGIEFAHVPDEKFLFWLLKINKEGL